MGGSGGSTGDIRDPYAAERLEAIAPEAYHSRREFLQRTAVAAGLAAGLGLVVDPETVVAEAARRQRAHQIPSPRNLPIDTFVVLMMENRSFDHYLGWLPGADGRQAGTHVHRRTGPRALDLPAPRQLPGLRVPRSRPLLGGRAHRARRRPHGRLSARPERRVLDRLLRRARPAVHAARREDVHRVRPLFLLIARIDLSEPRVHARRPVLRNDGQLAAVHADGRARVPDTTIFHALSKAGVANRYFYTDIPVSALWGAPGVARSSQVQTYYEQAATGTLPALSFVDPAFNGEDQGTSGDEHPHGDVRVGQAFIADVVHAFLESPQYKRGALFIVYDEWGGFFDHVVPPRVPDLRASSDLNSDFGQMGFRVPAVVVSPYARRGHVDHTIYGFESILKMIRYRYGLPPLTPRDLFANNIAAAFDFESKPDLTPPSLPQPPEVMSAACSGSIAGRLERQCRARRRDAARLSDHGSTDVAAPDAARPPQASRPRHDARRAATSSACISATGRRRRRRCSATRRSSGSVRRRPRFAIAAVTAAAVAALGRAAASPAPTVSTRCGSRSQSPRSRARPSRSRSPSTCHADADALDSATAPLRIRAKLAGECGGTFDTTPGPVLIDVELSPQPATGQPYQATARGSGKPVAYGQRTVCAFLEEEGDNRQFANDTVDRRWSTCPSHARPRRTATTRRENRWPARRQLRHANRRANRLRLKLVAKRGKTVARDRRAARKACGPGVPL